MLALQHMRSFTPKFTLNTGWKCQHGQGMRHKVLLCRPRLKYWMDYCQEHPDEMNKIASVQKKVSSTPVPHVV